MTQSAPKAWLSAVRCGTAVIGNVAERDADDRCRATRPMAIQLVVDDARVEQRADDGEHHADFAGEQAAARGGGGAQPLERKNEESRGDEVGRLR